MSGTVPRKKTSFRVFMILALLVLSSVTLSCSGAVPINGSVLPTANKYDLSFQLYLFPVRGGAGAIIPDPPQLWDRLPHENDLIEIYPDSFPTEIQAVLKCRVRADGTMKDCDITDLYPEGEQHREMMLRLVPAFKLPYETLVTHYPDGLTAGIGIKARNDNGQQTASSPCLPPFCQIIPPPPPNPPPPSSID